jgi:hypothetical protein
VKPRHAAALALVGWYLMVPPPVIHSSVPVDTDAPLSKWGIFSAHDSAADCEQTLVAFYKLAKTELVANPADERYRIRFYQLESSQCIANDDPRLKEKMSGPEKGKTMTSDAPESPKKGSSTDSTSSSPAFHRWKAAAEFP